MSRRSSEFWRLEARLIDRFGVPYGHIRVEFDWRTRAWRVTWYDGPTVEELRAAAAELAAPGIRPLLDNPRKVRFERSLSALAWAWVLIGMMRAGEALPALEDYGRRSAFEHDRVAPVSVPRSSAPLDDVELAGVLVAQAVRDHQRDIDEWRDGNPIPGIYRLDSMPPAVEAYLVQVLGDVGLGGLAALRQTQQILDAAGGARR